MLVLGELAVLKGFSCVVSFCGLPMLSGITYIVNVVVGSVFNRRARVLSA